MALHFDVLEANRKRKRVLNVRITDDERAMIDALAEHFGLAQSDTVRQVLRQAYRREGLAEHTTRATRAKRGGKHK